MQKKHTSTSRKKIASFTIFCQPPEQMPGYYLQNDLRFEDPSKHNQVAGESCSSPCSVDDDSTAPFAGECQSFLTQQDCNCWDF